MSGKLTLLLVAFTSAARIRNGPAPSPAASPAGGPAGAPEGPLDGVKGFVDLLPYTPDRMNYQMTKSKCIDFINHMLDKSGHDATRLPQLMPKCLWKKEECAALEADLLSRIPASALPGGPAGAPAASPAALLATKRLRSKSPGSGDAVFGWCDTLYNMAKTRSFERLKHALPAPGMEPLPASTGDIHTDVKIMNKWSEKNLGGAPAPALSKAEKIWHKMKQVSKTLKAASGHDHFAPEREAAKKMVTKMVTKKKDGKDGKDEKDEKEEKGEKEKEEKAEEEEKEEKKK